MDKLNLKQVSRKIEAVRPVAANTIIRTGWIKCIRRAIGMKSGQLATRLGISQSALSELEKREEAGSITLKKLSEAAKALNCELVYCLIPKEPLDSMVESQAEAQARKILGVADTHMELEDQKVKIDIEDRVESLKYKLIETNKLW